MRRALNNNAATVLFGLVLLALPAGPANSGLLGIQAQVRYDSSQIKERGLPVVGDSKLTADYFLTLRRPLLPTSTLVSDFSVSLTGSGDARASQDATGWALNVFTDKPRYTLSGRFTRNSYGGSFGGLGSSAGSTTDYNMHLMLKEPAYPIVNVQFLRNVSSTSFAGSRGDNTSTSWIMSSYYDKAPFRFSYDRIRQSLDYGGAPGIEMRSQNAAVSLNHTLMPGLILSGEMSKSSTKNMFPTNTTTMDINRRELRLSMIPTRAVVADVALVSELHDQKTGTIPRSIRNNSISWNVRTDIYPGLSLDYGDQRQTQKQTGLLPLGTIADVTRNRSMSLAARLSEDATLNVARTISDYDITGTGSGAKQDSFQSAVHLALTRTTDLGLDYGRIKSTGEQVGLYDSSFMGVSIRDRTSPRLTLGMTYRRVASRSSLPGEGPFTQNGDVVDMDMLWQPNYRTGLNLRMSYQNTKGSNPSKLLSPAVNLRLQLDSSTSLTANYVLQNLRQWDTTNPFLVGQNTKGLSARLTHNFRNGSSLDLSYDFQGVSSGPFEWAKQLRASYTFNL